MQTTDIKEIIVRGVVREIMDFIVLIKSALLQESMSTILGSGSGNVIIKPYVGLASPSRTGNVFKYCGEGEESLDNLKRSIETIKSMKGPNIPIFLNTNDDQDLQLYDSLMYNKRVLDQENISSGNHSHLKVNNLVSTNYDNLLRCIIKQV